MGDKKVEIVDENNVSCLRFLPFSCAKKEMFIGCYFLYEPRFFPILLLD